MFIVSGERGTRFSIYFPSAEEAKENKAEESKTLPEGNGELILIVDDEENIRKATVATLTKFGYQTAVAVDGTDALAIYSQKSDIIDVVITDMAMPYMDGSALIRALRKLNPELKIIAMSGLMNDGNTNELRSLNVDSFLSKPFSADKLLTTLSAILHNPHAF